jgi:pimeloyl-ACP methyl ester carboxylesterase
MAFIELGTLKLWYDIHGHGPCVLFIPGTASDLRQLLNIFVSPLIEHFEVLSFDPRGIGQANSPGRSHHDGGEGCRSSSRATAARGMPFPAGGAVQTVARHCQLAGSEAR